MRWILTLFASLALFGCSDSDTVCTQTSDCFRGEVCLQGSCVDESEAMGNTNPNGSTNGNPNGSSNGSSNGSTNGAPNNEFCGFDQCVVDPFLCACGDDGNDSFADSISDQTIGCQSSGFIPLDTTFRARFCALEPVDKYSQLFIPCDTQTFRLEVTLKPVVEMCDLSLIKMNLSVQGKSCANQDQSPDITCSWNSEGNYVAQALIRPGSSVSTFNVTVDSGEREDVDFVYDMTVRVTE